MALAAHAFLTAGLGARPINDLIHRTGYWALIFLLVTLAVTPLARIGRFSGLIDVRRMLGVGAFVYAATHILLFTADQMFDLFKVATEIVLRLYLTIGFIALLGLAGAGGDFDRCHGASTRETPLAAAAPGRLWHRAARADPLLPADQGRYLGADLRRRSVRLVDGLPAADALEERRTVGAVAPAACR